MRKAIPGWGLGGAAEGRSDSLGVIPLSLCLNMSLGFTARWEMSEAASWNTSKRNCDEKLKTRDCGFLGEAPQEERTIYCHTDEAACGEDHSQRSTSERERGQDERGFTKGGTHVGFFHRFPSPDCLPFILLLLLLLMGSQITGDTRFPLARNKTRMWGS